MKKITRKTIREKKYLVTQKTLFIAPVNGKIISKYNPNSEKKKNQGIDFKVSQVLLFSQLLQVSVALITDNTENFGKIILIRHDNNFISIYGRVSKVL